MHRAQTVAWLGVALLLAGCASPAYRIRKHPELFASFPPEAQAKVSEGRVEMGFTSDMVFLALGRPNRVYTRHTDAGDSLIWSYSRQRYHSSWRPVGTVHYRRDRRGRLRPYRGWTWVDAGYFSEYEALRVEMTNDTVSAIEVLQR